MPSLEDRGNLVTHKRWISRGPSSEIEQLSLQIPDLYGEASESPLFSSLPLNLGGSVFLEFDRKINPEIYPELDAATQIITFLENNTVNIAGNIIEANALFNQAYGVLSSGVVLSGPYTGVVFEDGHYRVWPDRPLDYRLPDIPRALAYPDSQSQFLKRFLAYRDELSIEKGMIWFSDLFFDLCSRLDIPVEKHNFHSTRSVIDPSV